METAYSPNIKFKAAGDLHLLNQTLILCADSLKLLVSKEDTENYKQPGVALRHPESLSPVSFPGPSKLGHLE